MTYQPLAQEAESQRIELPEEEPSMVYRMLQHLYMQTYTVNLCLDGFYSVNDSWAKARLHVHAQMYSLGDKYDVPSLKKEAARRFVEDVEIPRHSKCEIPTLLSVVSVVYVTTPESDRTLRDVVVRQIFQRYDTASKHFVEELDTALEVRQFARDIIVLHSKRPSMEYAVISKEVYRIWHCHVRPFLVATMSAFPSATALRARVLATGVTLGALICLYLVALMFVSILKGYLVIILRGQFETFEQRRDSFNCWARSW